MFLNSYRCRVRQILRCVCVCVCVYAAVIQTAVEDEGSKWDWRRSKVREKTEKQVVTLLSLCINMSAVFFSAWEALTSRPVSSLVFIKSFLTFHREAVWVKTCLRELFKKTISCQIDDEKNLSDTQNGCELESSVTSSAKGKTKSPPLVQRHVVFLVSSARRDWRCQFVSVGRLAPVWHGCVWASQSLIQPGRTTAVQRCSADSRLNNNNNNNNNNKNTFYL